MTCCSFRDENVHALLQEYEVEHEISQRWDLAQPLTQETLRKELCFQMRSIICAMQDMLIDKACLVAFRERHVLSSAQRASNRDRISETHNKILAAKDRFNELVQTSNSAGSFGLLPLLPDSIGAIEESVRERFDGQTQLEATALRLIHLLERENEERSILKEELVTWLAAVSLMFKESQRTEASMRSTRWRQELQCALTGLLKDVISKLNQ